MSRNVVDLPEELIGEILLRLPVKAILRFKCVCKEWCALIRSQSFMDDHFNHKSNLDCQLIMFLCHRMGNEFAVCGDDGRHLRSETSNYPSQMRKCAHLLGPANGIFCVVGYSPDMQMTLLNPATRKLKLLPPIPLPELRHHVIDYGFGFDPVSGDYKVVVFEVVKKPQRYSCVYNSSSDSWSKTEVVDWLKEKFLMMICRGVHLNGVYHWLIYDLISYSILGFDMRTENFHEIALPDAIASQRPAPVTRAYGDSLALFSRPDVHMIDMWLMGKDDLWTQSFSIAIDLPHHHIVPLFVWNKTELLIGAAVDLTVQTLDLFKCDISTHQVRKIEPIYNNCYWIVVFSYKESLFSIEGEREIP